MKPTSPETRRFINEHLSDDVRMLALQSAKYPAVDMPMAINQISGRQIAAGKLPSWYEFEEIIYPPHLPLEQCSSEQTARYKAGLLKGNSLTDLTGGFGIDCAFLSANFKNVTYVERQPGLCELAQHNFSCLGLTHIAIRNEDSTGYLNEMSPVDCIYIDPARRNKQGGKTFLISDCEPDVQELEELLLRKAATVMVKLSPMLDLSLALKTLSHVTEAHIISVKNECKELLLILKREIVEETPVHCINIQPGNHLQSFTFTRKQESDTSCEYTEEVGAYLYEPNASVLKAGAFKSIAAHYDLKKLHPSSHLYTSGSVIENFPGRIFSVLAYGSVKDKLISGDIKKANIATRNFPYSAPELRKKLKLQEGGNIYLFGTTLSNNKKIVIKAEKLL